MLWLWWAIRRLFGRIVSASGSSRSGRHRSLLPRIQRTDHNVEIKAVDGDTIKVEGVPRKIRLARIDAPEKGDPGAEWARQFVERKLSEAENVRLTSEQAGHYGRYVAEIEVAGENLSDMMMERGLPELY